LRPSFPSLSIPILRIVLIALGLLQSAISTKAADLNSQEQQIFNSLKYAGGQRRPFVVLDPMLCRVARQKAADMANRGYYSHTDPDGHGPNWLVRQAGYSLPDHYDQSPSGNNIESVNAGRASAGDAWSSWMDSGGHRQHLLAENTFYSQQTSVGIGFVDDPGSQWRYYWVVITAPPSGPAISIKTPKAGQEITSSTASISGSTMGKPAAAHVEVRIENAAGTGEWSVAEGTSSWSINVNNLLPGANTVYARSLDSGGTVLDTTSRNVRYVVVAPLTVQITGRGTVTKGFEGTSDREVGQTFRVTAKAAPGSLFAGWSGSLNTTGATAEFVMSEGFNLTASFIENPYLAGRANYSGLSATSTGSPALLSLKLGGSGLFSGKLRLTDLTIPLRGMFDSLGRAQFTTIFKGQTFDVDLTYALIDDVPSITGTIGNDSWTMPVDISALGKLQDSSLVGRYTVVLRAEPGAPETVPQGDGFGIAQINRSGTTKFAGQLADGTPFAASGHLTRTGALPVFLAPYKKSGAFAGSLTFHAPGDVEGQFHWSRPANTKSAVFPNGFTTANMAAGARYTAPKHGQPVVRVGASTNNARLELGEGGLAYPVLQPATIEFDNSVIISAPAVPGVSLSIKRATGQFHGQFIHPVTGSQTPFRGVVVQKENAGFGFFVANGASGYATLGAAAESQP
jgi:uncharacterized protein YkwD